MVRPRSELGDIRTSPRSVKILRWLRRKPQPAHVHGETLDGEEVKAVVSATGPAQWTDVLGVVRHCVKLTALDKAGETLRVLELDPKDPELLAEAEAEQALAVATKGGSVPIISVDLPKLVDNLARNIREVAGESARMHQAATRDAFAGMASVVNLCIGLLVRMENRLAQTEDALTEATTAAQGEPGDSRAKLAEMALQQMMRSNGASNGNGGGFDLGSLMKALQQAQQGDDDAQS